MKPDKIHTQTYNYSELFFDYFFHHEKNCTRKCPEHVLVFIYSGELVAGCDQCKVTVRSGEYIFLHKDIYIQLEKKPGNDQPFRSVSLGFNQSFLYECYRNMDKTKIPTHTDNFDRNVVELTKNPYLQSLYISMIPYVEGRIKPIRSIMEIKLMEAVLSLLITDERFYACLFDNIKPDECNTYQFNEELFAGFAEGNLLSAYHKHQHMSTATIKKWVTEQRLETAYIRMQETASDTHIYMEVGYKKTGYFIQTLNCGYDHSTLN